VFIYFCLMLIEVELAYVVKFGNPDIEEKPRMSLET
jgi:hypothetical protein